MAVRTRATHARASRLVEVAGVTYPAIRGIVDSGRIHDPFHQHEKLVSLLKQDTHNDAASAADDGGANADGADVDAGHDQDGTRNGDGNGNENGHGNGHSRESRASPDEAPMEFPRDKIKREMMRAAALVQAKTGKRSSGFSTVSNSSGIALYEQVEVGCSCWVSLAIECWVLGRTSQAAMSSAVHDDGQPMFDVCLRVRLQVHLPSASPSKGEGTWHLATIVAASRWPSDDSLVKLRVRARRLFFVVATPHRVSLEPLFHFVSSSLLS